MKKLTGVYVIVDRDKNLIQMRNGNVYFSTINGAQQAFTYELREKNNYWSRDKSEQQLLDNGYIVGYERTGFKMLFENELIERPTIALIAKYLLDNIYTIVLAENVKVNYV